MRSPVDLVAGANVVVPKKRPPNMGLDIEFFAASTPYGASAHPNGALDGPKLPYKRLVKLTAKKSVKRFQKKLRSIKGAEATRVLTRQRGGGSGAPRGGAETVGAGLTIDPFDASASNGGADGPSSIAPNAARHATPHLALYHKWEKDLDDMQLGSLGDADAHGSSSSSSGKGALRSSAGGSTFRANRSALRREAPSTKTKGSSPKSKRRKASQMSATAAASSSKKHSALRGAARTMVSPRMRAAAEQTTKLSAFWERHPQLERLQGGGATKKKNRTKQSKQQKKRSRAAASKRGGASEVALSSEMRSTVRDYISTRLHTEEIDESVLHAIENGSSNQLVGLSVARNGTLRTRNPIEVGFSTGSAALLRRTRGAGEGGDGRAQSAGDAAATMAATARSMAALRRTTRAALGADDFWGDEIASPLAAPLDATALCHRSKRARQQERLPPNVAPAFSLATLVRGGAVGNGLRSGLVGELGLFPYSNEAHAQATVIQREWRRVLGTNDSAAIAVQRRMRGILQRRRTLRQIATLTSRLLVIQAIVRGHLKRRWMLRYEEETLYHAALRTQKNFRGFRVRLRNERNRVALELECATRAQCAFRCFTARRRVQRVRVAMLHGMANHIQRCARGHAGRTFAHAKRVRMYGAATMIQATVRQRQGAAKAAAWRKHYYDTAAGRLQLTHRKHYTDSTLRALFRSLHAVVGAETARALRETLAVESWVLERMEAERRLWRKPKGWAKVRRKRKEIAKKRKTERQVVRYMTPAQKNRRRVAQLFEYYDVDGSGLIDRRELGLILGALGARPSTAELDFYMMQIDADGSGEIDMDEFYNWFTSDACPASQKSTASILRRFAPLDLLRSSHRLIENAFGARERRIARFAVLRDEIKAAQKVATVKHRKTQGAPRMTCEHCFKPFLSKVALKEHKIMRKAALLRATVQMDVSAAKAVAKKRKEARIAAAKKRKEAKAAQKAEKKAAKEKLKLEAEKAKKNAGKKKKNVPEVEDSSADGDDESSGASGTSGSESQSQDGETETTDGDGEESDAGEEEEGEEGDGVERTPLHLLPSPALGGMLAASSVVRLAEEAWEKPLDASDIAEEDVDSARGAIAELRRNLTAMHASTARISSKAAHAAEIKAAKAEAAHRAQVAFESDDAADDARHEREEHATDGRWKLTQKEDVPPPPPIEPTPPPWTAPVNDQLVAAKLLLKGGRTPELLLRVAPLSTVCNSARTHEFSPAFHELLGKFS